MVPCVRFVCFVRCYCTSYTYATLGTGGWLALTRQGLASCKKRQASLGARRGRDAGYPTPPAQIPACGFPAPGSSVVLASAVLIALDIAILLREVGLCAPVRHVRHKFPVRTAYHRQPLPRVVGSPALKVLWVDPTPWRPSAPLLGVTYLSETGAVRVSQVPDASLHAYHALKWTPADPRAAHQHAASV